MADKLRQQDEFIKDVLEMERLSHGWTNAAKEGLKYGVGTWREVNNPSITTVRNICSIVGHIMDYHTQLKQGIREPKCHDTGRCPLENALCRLIMLKARHELGVTHKELGLDDNQEVS